MAAAIDEPLAVGPGRLDPETLHGSPEMTADDWESHGKAAVSGKHQDFFKTDSGDGSSGKQWFWDTILIWLVVWLPCFIFPINIGNFIIPIDVHIFQRGG